MFICPFIYKLILTLIGGFTHLRQVRFLMNVEIAFSLPLHIYISCFFFLQWLFSYPVNSGKADTTVSLEAPATNTDCGTEIDP
jgi:hypothetical protein